MIKNELQRFLLTLNKDEISVDIRKMANLIFHNIEILEPLGTTHSTRTKKIIELLSSWETQSDIITDSEFIYKEADIVHRLDTIKVGPFRGFVKEEVLKIDSLRVFIYGPNGTGKSSFCEALEFALLGSVVEAQNKRFAAAQYLKNAHVNRYIDPIVEGQDGKGNTVKVLPNESAYRFCFIEKNRIDNFSRIAAQVPAKQTELIANLFGLENFNNFVKNFSRDLDPRYIDLIGQKAGLLKEKQQQIIGYYETLENNKKLLEINKNEKQELATKFSQKSTFDQMLLALGNNEYPGKIQEIENELKEQLNITGLSINKLKVLKVRVEDAYSELNKILAQLEQAKEGISFKQLYSAVRDLQDSGLNHCPACKTPLYEVKQNPFSLAVIELSKLEHLSSLELEKDKKHKNFLKELHCVYEIIQICSNLNKDIDDQFNVYLGVDTNILNWEWWESLFSVSNESVFWDIIISHVQRLELLDNKSRKAIEERESKQEYLKVLREFREEAIKLQSQHDTHLSNIKSIQQAIDVFDEENKLLIAEVEAEKLSVKKNIQLADAYKQLIDLLIVYKEQLPRNLISDLSELVVQFYNAFNRYDDDKELLAQIKLPLVSGEHIEVSYRSNPEKFYNALHILSEGHIRCIGLSILLAKNIKTDSPFVIFDDPVNAIDDEHRKAIRETLYMDDFFKEKQIILACHGEEFLKNIHQDIGFAAVKESQTYKFLPKQGDDHIHISSFLSPPNYILSAITYCDAAEYRNALSSARRALEYLSEKLWHHYSKYCHKDDKLISISKRSPSMPHDLRLLIENLKSSMNKSKTDIPSKENIIEELSKLLGINGKDPHWLYLNKGTHEESDRVEFESETVRSIISSLENLDKLLNM